MMTFPQFQATRTDCADLGAMMGADFYDGDGIVTRAGYTYAGNCYIELIDGSPSLMLGRDEYREPLESLELRLYAWALTESPDALGVPDDVADFIANLQNNMTADQFIAAMVANRDESIAGVCHMHDYCDANQCALDAAGGDDGNQAARVYDAARPFIRCETVAVGQRVKFIRPHDIAESRARFLVLELRGPRVLVEAMDTGMRIAPQHVYPVADMVHA